MIANILMIFVACTLLLMLVCMAVIGWLNRK
jgi:hypothetical protein